MANNTSTSSAANQPIRNALNLILSSYDHLNTTYTVQLGTLHEGASLVSSDDTDDEDDDKSGGGGEKRRPASLAPSEGPTLAGETSELKYISSNEETSTSTSTARTSPVLPTNDPRDFQDGQVLYRVSTPFKLTSKTSKIEKTQGSSHGDLATIEHHTFTSSKFKFGGGEALVSEFFKKQGFRFLAHARDRKFTGPDGKRYKWIIGCSYPYLTLDDANETLVAKYHRKRFGVFQKARPAFLEITSLGLHMVDLIFITFVYAKKLRDDRERANRGHGGGGP